MVSRIYMLGNGDGWYVRFAPNFGFQLGRLHWCVNPACRRKGFN